MSKDRLNVLWLDDEHESFKELKAYFYNHGIDVKCYKSQLGALETLRNNGNHFDAILCDIQILENESSKNESNKHLIPFIKGISALGLDLDPVILTGQGEKNRNEIDIMLTFLEGKTVLYKSDPEVQPKIVSALNEKASNRPLFNVKKEFRSVYKLYEAGHLDDIAILPFKEFFSNPRLNREHCNSLRQTLESLYNRLSKLGIIPQAVYSNTTEGKNAVDFLMCSPVNGIQLDSKFRINNNVRRWLSDHFYDCSLGSHIPDDNYELRELFEDVGTDLHHSVVASLFRFEEIALYFSHWIPKILASEEFKNGNHITKVTNPSESSETKDVGILATVTKIHAIGFGFAKSGDQTTYYLPQSRVNSNLIVGDQILITKIEPPSKIDGYEQIVSYSKTNA
jgi:CheY-like chemotaxis protein